MMPHAELLQGDDEQPIRIVAPSQMTAFHLTQLQAEKLLYDLHAIVQTLKGHNRKYTWRERLRARLRRR